MDEARIAPRYPVCHHEFERVDGPKRHRFGVSWQRRRRGRHQPLASAPSANWPGLPAGEVLADRFMFVVAPALAYETLPAGPLKEEPP
jgi:hypothetical protein